LVLLLDASPPRQFARSLQIQGNIDREMAVARELVGQGRKERALLALKRRKLQEGQAAKLDAWLLNVEQMVGWCIVLVSWVSWAAAAFRWGPTNLQPAKSQI
jgi:hypothetical protein